MAFSLGIISYTISTLVTKIEEAAEEILGNDEQTAPKVVVDDETAKEIFQEVSEKSKHDDVEAKKPKVTEQAVRGAEADPTEDGPADRLSDPAWAPMPIYEDRQVTGYFLTYNYDLDDLANTRLRSSFRNNASRLIQKSLSEQRQRQAESAVETERLRKEAAVQEEAKRAREKADLRRSSGE